jgi:hypothetical protein
VGLSEIGPILAAKSGIMANPYVDLGYHFGIEIRG